MMRHVLSGPRRGLRRLLGPAALAVLGCLPVRAAAEGAKRPAQPNIVFILADDFGWKDVGYNGSTFHRTPAIDALARRGMVFTRGYAAAPLCSPTRASLLTGKYPARVWLTKALVPADYGKEPGVPPSAPPHFRLATPTIRDRIRDAERTLPEALKEAGYATALIGKWHLGPADVKPEGHGFDVNIAGGHYPGPPSYFSPYRIHNLPDGPKGEYLTDRLTDEAVRFIEKNRDRPFFLYLPHYAVHSPWQAKPELEGRYRAPSDPNAPQHNPTYAAMIHSLDESVGRVLKALDQQGLADRTLVVFTSDNGGLLQVPGREGAAEPRGGLKAGDPVTSNTPLRGGKAWIHEGGLRVPTVVLWPGVTRPGSVCDVPVITADFYPTLLEAAGAARRPDQVIDGASLTPLLRGGATLGRDAIYFHFPHYIAGYRKDPDQRTFWARPSSAILQGDYKLIHYYDGDVELYNLKEDAGEKDNLAAKMPDKVAALRAKLLRWLKETGAQIPVPNPNYAPRAARQRPDSPA